MIKADYYDKILADCHCPRCNREYQRYVEKAHVKSPYAWRINGKLAITCEGCKNGDYRLRNR